MKCPTCNQSLQRKTYEGVQVWQCPGCAGYLIARSRLRLIKNSRQETPESLQSQAATEQAPDTADRVRCPRCRVEKMTKERVRIDDDEFFHLDVCRSCNLVWLDGGELAKVQTQYEQSSQAVDLLAFRERYESRTDEQRTEFQRRLAELQPDRNALDTLLDFIAAPIIAAALLMAVCLFLELWLPAAGAVLVMGGLFELLILFRLGVGTTVRFALMAVTGVAELGLLVWIAHLAGLLQG